MNCLAAGCSQHVPKAYLALVFASSPCHVRSRVQHVFPTCPSWGLFLIPTAWKRHLWPTDLTLVNIDQSKICPHKSDDLLHALYCPAKYSCSQIGPAIYESMSFERQDSCPLPKPRERCIRYAICTMYESDQFPAKGTTPSTSSFKPFHQNSSRAMHYLLR